jgi:hypothetical protein
LNRVSSFVSLCFKSYKQFISLVEFFILTRQDDWSELLHFAEMAMNNAVNRSSKMNPFEINYGFSPYFDILAVNTNNVVLTVDTFMNKLRGIWTETVKNLKNAAIMMKKDSDCSRRDADFKVGQYVLLDTEHLKRHRHSRKLDFKRIHGFNQQGN